MVERRAQACRSERGEESHTAQREFDKCVGVAEDSDPRANTVRPYELRVWRGVRVSCGDL